MKNLIIRLLLIAETSFRLGLFNSFYAFWYKISLRLGIQTFLCRISEFVFPVKDPATPYFSVNNFKEISKDSIPGDKIIEEADLICEGGISFFSDQVMSLGAPLDWFLNPFNLKTYDNLSEHWTRCREFKAEIGDIKCIWEASRFNWAPTLVKAYRLTGEGKYVNTLNAYIDSWVRENPSFLGPNWKCGQEASFRCFNLLIAFKLLERKELSLGLENLFYNHLERVNLNIRYALVQDNNHATSEAICIFILGALLSKHASCDKTKNRARKLRDKGRRLIEHLVSKLILDDGSFSQNSVNYHRVLIDSLSILEIFRKEFGEKDFSKSFKDRVELAFIWLSSFVDSVTGDAPNLGANDGAYILNLSNSHYRDFRPSLQTFSALYRNKLAYLNEDLNESLVWLGVDYKSYECRAVNLREEFKSGGYLIKHQGASSLFFRLPKYYFRPSHSDALHVDYWYKGKPILIDGGSYSYNDDSGVGDYLKGTRAHNTISFDDKNQMPTIGKFLFGKWICGEFDISKLTASYKDFLGNFHERKLDLKSDSLVVKDRVIGKGRRAVLYWHLSSEIDWEERDSSGSFVLLSSSMFDLRISSDSLISYELSSCPSSLFYNKFKLVPCLKVEIAREGRIISELIQKAA